MAKAEQDHRPSEASSPGTEVHVAMVATGGLGLVAALVGLLGWDFRVAAGIFTGATIAVANLWVFKRIGIAFLSEGGRSRAVWGLIGALKFVVLLAGVGSLLRYGVVDAIPLIVGYAALPAGITLSNWVTTRVQDGT